MKVGFSCVPSTKHVLRNQHRQQLYEINFQDDSVYSSRFTRVSSGPDATWCRQVCATAAAGLTTSFCQLHFCLFYCCHYWICQRILKRRVLSWTLRHQAIRGWNSTCSLTAPSPAGRESTKYERHPPWIYPNHLDVWTHSQKRLKDQNTSIRHIKVIMHFNCVTSKAHKKTKISTMF